MKNKIFKIAFILSIFTLMIACNDDEDYTGASTLDIGDTSTLSITMDETTISTIESEAEEYPFTLTLSEAKPFDIHVSIEQTSGDATSGEDFSIPSSLTIPAYSTSVSGSLAVISDDLIESTETASFTIGAVASNVSVTPVTVDLTIVNATAGDLVADLSWANSTTITDSYGNEIDPYTFADLRLLLTNVPYTQVFDGADGATAETYTLAADAPDGEYYLVTDFYAAMEDAPAGVDLTLSFNQVGTINDLTYTFPSALSTAYVCENNYFVMAKITKSGTSYTIEEVAENSSAPTITAGTYDVVSNGMSTDSGPVNNPLVDFMSTVTISDNGDGTYTLSDGWAGVYIDWYSIYGNTEPEPQTLVVSICGEFSADWGDIFGGQWQALRGTINADGTLSVRIDNGWGDYVDAVYTLQ